TITQIDITVCNRRVDPGAKLQTRRCLDGTCTDSGTNINPGASYASDTQSYTGLSITKTASTDLEIGVKNTSDKGVRVSQLSAAITYTTADVTAPAAVTNLAAGTPAAAAIPLTWTAPGDDGSTGTAATYDVRFSTGNITSGNWGNASAASGEPAPSASGSSESFTLSGLTPNTRYFAALKTSDEAGNESGLSNVINKYTLANPPAAAAFGAVTETSIVANWLANSNPDGTQYYTENQTANTNSGWITDTTWTSSALTAGTTYTFRVKARNAEGTETDWVSLGSKATTSASDTTTVSEGTTTTISASSTSTSTTAATTSTSVSTSAVPAATGPTIAVPTVAPKPDAAPIGAPGTTTPDTSAGETTTAVPILPTAGDTVPPAITITKAPAISAGTSVSLAGAAKESTAQTSGVIASLAYSYDGGISWHPVSSVEGLGDTRASFTILTPALPDGTYRITIRARDNSSNESQIESDAITIDQLPVIFGGAVFLTATSDALPTADPTVAAGAPLRFIAAIEGGVTHASLKVGEQAAILAPDAIRRRFSTIITSTGAGTYPLQLQAIDGAGHKLSQDIGTLTVLPALTISDSDARPLPDAIVTLEVFDAAANVWRRDTTPSQINPQSTQADGSIILQTREGTYRLRVKAPGHWRTITRSFTLTNPAALTGALALPRRPWYQYLLPVKTYPLPLPSDEIFAVNEPQTTDTQEELTLSPRDLAHTERPLDEFAGHRLLLTTITGWNRTSQEQLAILQRLQDDLGKDVTIIPWLVQQPASVLIGLLQRGQYTLPGFADLTGLDTASLQRTIIPTHFLFDRDGRLQAKRAGFANINELIELLRHVQ
ncbi:MAG: hypothetical protein HY372_03075, partial [Candidatus Andersenbacteria bacterium]|nr:hypothetical protein [Candidatus Andersenbacteria bacterium]